MRYFVRILLFGTAAMLVSQQCQGSSLTLSVVQDPSSQANLSALTAGQSVTFDVNLSGLDVADGQTLGSLEGTVVFDGSLLGQPVSVTPGAIVDPTGFLPAVNPGLADGTYYFGFSNSLALVTANGTFFAFTVVVQPNVTGSGVLTLDPSQGGYVAAFDANINPVDIAAGADLHFAVGPAAVPEPASVLMAAISLVVGLARAWFTRDSIRATTRRLMFESIIARRHSVSAPRTG